MYWANGQAMLTARYRLRQRVAETSRSPAACRTIRSGELEVQGDIQVVQNFVGWQIWQSSTLRNCWPLIPVIRR